MIKKKQKRKSSTVKRQIITNNVSAKNRWRFNIIKAREKIMDIRVLKLYFNFRIFFFHVNNETRRRRISVWIEQKHLRTLFYPLCDSHKSLPTFNLTVKYIYIICYTTPIRGRRRYPAELFFLCSATHAHAKKLLILHKHFSVLFIIIYQWSEKKKKKKRSFYRIFKSTFAFYFLLVSFFIPK